MFTFDYVGKEVFQEELYTLTNVYDFLNNFRVCRFNFKKYKEVSFFELIVNVIVILQCRDCNFQFSLQK